jgi:hypothetical protein
MIAVAVAGIPETIRRSMRILATHRALFGRRDRDGRTARTMTEADIARVIEVFETNHVRWAIAGAHAIALITEPRATVDFDFIIESATIDGIVHELTARFGQLDENDTGATIQLRTIDVDLVRSTVHPLLEIALDQLRMVGDWRVPRTEVLVVLKFLGVVGSWRARNKRMHDMADICRVCHAAAGELDRALMIELSALVYPGAEREFSELLGKIDRDEPISI